MKERKIDKIILLNRLGQMKTERASWISHWREITDLIMPRAGRYFLSDRDKGYRRHNNILDNTGTRALGVLCAGLMAGASSPARQWFKLATSDPELNKDHNVRLWCDDVTKLMQDVFRRSNTYRALSQIYEEVAAFGTGASLIFPDEETILHQYPCTTGEYCIAKDFKGNICTIYREYEVTVGELVKEFGYEACSNTVKTLYDTSNLDQWVPIVHAIEPRTDRDKTKIDSKNMAWGSYVFEPHSDKNDFLKESGFKEFPAVVPRWSVTGGDIYGNSPAMEALGDIRQLQFEQQRKSQAIDMQIHPPLQAPLGMKNRDVDMMPGGVTFVDQLQGIKTAYEVNINLKDLKDDILEVQKRIRASFHSDLLLMITDSDTMRMTATEVAARHEEKLLMLGPVLERLHNELLSPLVDSTFNRMVEAGRIPAYPPEMEGAEINVEFVSMLAQAQKAVGTTSIDRFVANLGQVAQFKPEVLDKFDQDKWADIYSDLLGVDPSLIISGKNVAMVRQERNAQVQQQQQQQMALEQAKVAPEMSSMEATQMFSGYSGGAQ